MIAKLNATFANIVDEDVTECQGQNDDTGIPVQGLLETHSQCTQTQFEQKNNPQKAYNSAQVSSISAYLLFCLK